MDLLQDVPPDLIAFVRHVHGELLGPTLESLFVLAFPWRRLTGVLATKVRDRLNEIFVINLPLLARAQQVPLHRACSR